MTTSTANGGYSPTNNKGNISLPPAAQQGNCEFYKYRAYHNNIYIKLYSNIGTTIILKYTNIMKLRERTTSSTAGRTYETVFLSTHETTMTTNRDGVNVPETNITRHYARINFNTKILMFIQKSFRQTLYNNEGLASANKYEDYGIKAGFNLFNEIVDKVEAINVDLESISLSSTQLENDI